MENSPFFNVVLVEPEIPNNTGNIGRTCVGTQCLLHLVGPLGFEITDKRVKRAGLDYWPHLNYKVHSNWEEFVGQVPNPERMFFFSTKASKSLYQSRFQPGDWLVFGRETKGLPEQIIANHMEQAIRIPMWGPIRSLNLANAVAASVFEGLRQTQLK